MTCYGIDAIGLQPGVSVSQIREAGPNVFVYLNDPEGRDDTILMRGDGLNADNLTIIEDYILAGV